MAIQGVDWDQECTRTVKDFPTSLTERFSFDAWQSVVAKSEAWQDETFPAGPTSLLDSEVRKEARHESWKSFTWKRPQEVYEDGSFVIFETPEPTAFSKGSCEDSVFLAAVSAIAEQPSRIKNLFLTQSVNKAGCYAVKLYVNGEPKTVVVDDYFPYDSAENKWAFASPVKVGPKIEIWILILEKAWAKVCGNY